MSDCDPLACTFEKCHEECRANGDCEPGWMCVVSDSIDGGAASGLHVCINDRCIMNSQCPGSLICARDFQCRQACATDKDCAREDDRCVVGNMNGDLVCARPIEVDGGVLNGDGPLPPPLDASPGDAGDDAPASDTAGTGDGGPDAPPDAPRDGGVDAPADMAPDGGVDAPADMAPDGGVDAPADAPADGGAEVGLGPCGIPEPEPNEDRTAATPYPLKTDVVGCIGSGADHDVYVIRVPAGDKAGGYFRASITDVGPGAISAYLYAGVDNGLIHMNQNIQPGLFLYLYWAGVADGKYYLDLARFGGGGSGATTFKYTLHVDYVPINDPYEPNDTTDTPVAIALGTPVTAYYYTGFSQYRIAPTEFQDWYKVDLAAGTLDVVMESVPLKTALRFTLYTLGNVVVGNSKTSPNQGGGFTHSVNIQTPGTYKILIDANPHADAMAASEMMAPDSFTRPYTLTVRQ